MVSKLEIATATYVYFKERLYQKPTEGVYRKSDISCIANFLKKREKEGLTIGINFLFEYNLYHFLRVFNHFAKGKVPDIYVSQVYGDKAYLMWRNRKEGWVHYSTNFLESRNIVPYVAKASIMRSLVKDKPNFFKSSPLERDARKKQNIYICLMQTSLWNPTDKSCQTCSFQSTCKKALKAEYPYVYKKRKAKEFIKEIKWTRSTLM